MLVAQLLLNDRVNGDVTLGGLILRDLSAFDTMLATVAAWEHFGLTSISLLHILLLLVCCSLGGSHGSLRGLQVRHRC